MLSREAKKLKKGDVLYKRKSGERIVVESVRYRERYHGFAGHGYEITTDNGERIFHPVLAKEKP